MKYWHKIGSYYQGRAHKIKKQTKPNHFLPLTSPTKKKTHKDKNNNTNNFNSKQYKWDGIQ